MNIGTVQTTGLDLLFLCLSLSNEGSSCLGSLFTGALQGSMRTCWKESKGAFRHYNLSEGSWLVPWCLWAAGARALSLLVLYTYKPMLWDRSRLGGRGLEGKRDGRGTDAETELQREASLSLCCPLLPSPEALQSCSCHISFFFFSPSDISLFGYLSD